MNAIPAPLACRPSCGACCTAPSITSPIPGMPNGKPAGVRCIQLADDNRCLIFGRPERPAFCGGLQPSAEMCGTSRGDAIRWLSDLERATCPKSLINTAEFARAGDELL
ncbi:YkgJ family cysteine cluster protein [Rugamonas sp. CCM 8940]|uniref:YkgJ family cysteine cluster protein n=1 Tax=Rugamonas sp. CCM 8940 TaxID=2765359 RepID=UPI0018F39325|nr:YkgJ family cysteine cluster protein [Rugamonas sp. CCM 8940]MBJ7311521.1 YkgJ family cysteine cluster protein [Rugamonas sp. CCM 8940]